MIIEFAAVELSPLSDDDTPTEQSLSAAAVSDSQVDFSAAVLAAARAAGLEQEGSSAGSFSS
jgi:hypothetical protein